MLTLRTVLLRIVKVQMMRRRRITIMETQLIRITDLRVVGNRGNGRGRGKYHIKKRKRQLLRGSHGSYYIAGFWVRALRFRGSRTKRTWKPLYHNLVSGFTLSGMGSKAIGKRQGSSRFLGTAREISRNLFPQFETEHEQAHQFAAAFQLKTCAVGTRKVDHMLVP